ncbi:uncharacterized protein FFUJ_11878 [Fusarium fujikuroi IMI 58289]|uniref:Zn(2)-C6 fungal-type domain-containing protein n=1 Tax=Gibberella fujikuroi (strain CBS 195.34 / IMI 58289 / NRRL A-6831) TaxID=1279085 RepID=S0EM38_GIBF5|nr:LOW QUALITY PROTEIN: uncharacterized protein FFUJ_11878 [Fusarium fujikuroi IMI 58289]CCT76098.1 uncharacterized protein FFUJ_11878 [Fusarium fujikuroi IMI 58289]
MNPIRTSRAGKRSTRSRLGCRTCNTGRACDGYGVWDSKHPLPSTTKSPSQHMNPSCSVSRDRHTQLYFDWFVTRARKKIPGIFASEFWDTLVLQHSGECSPILTSGIGLCPQIGNALAGRHARKRELHIAALQRGHISVQHHLVTGNKESIRIVTISCLIFICLEFMRGNIKTGADHLQNGLNLLPLLNSPSCLGDGALVLKAHNESIEDVVTEAFLRLCVYSARFHRFPRNISIVTQDDALSGQSRSFPTLAVARLHLDELFNRIHRLEADARQLQALPCSITTTMLQNQRRIQKDLDCWLSLFKHSYEDIANNDSEESLPLTLLRIHHAMAYVMAGTCIAPSDELAYDLFKSSFDSVVSLSDHILEAAASVMAADIICGACTEKFSFSADMGIILPLYYTILKCRCPVTRRRALKVLLPVSHQEGIWNGPLAAAIACRVIQIEEEGYYGCSPIEDHPLESLIDAPIPTLPESHRISGVFIDPPESSTGDIIWGYRRAQENGQLAILQESVKAFK